MVNPGQPITDSLDLRWLYWHSELAVQTILPQQIVMLLKKFISLHSSQQLPSASWLGMGLLRPSLIILKCDWLYVVYFMCRQSDNHSCYEGFFFKCNGTIMSRRHSFTVFLPIFLVLEVFHLLSYKVS